MDRVPVRAVVDDDGRLVELVLSRELLAQQPWAVSRAIVAAVNEVQDAMRVRHEHLADPAALAAALDEANFEADRRPPTGTPGGGVQPGRISVYGLVP